jgi:2'-5' RNA ligase
MRLFMAVEVTDEVRAWAAGVRRALERTRPAAASGLRWVDPLNVHLTLRFLGDTAPEVAELLRASFSRAIPRSPFAARVQRVEWIPPSGRPRVLVAGVGEGADHLKALRAEVDATLEGVAGIGPEQRPFLAHVTLARVRDDAEKTVVAAKADVAKACGGPIDFVVPVSEVVLIESELSPRGPRYTTRARARLVSGGER